MLNKLMILVMTCIIAFSAVDAFAQDAGIPDTLRFEPPLSDWTIESDADSMFTVELWLWTDASNIRFGCLPFKVTTNDGGTGHNDSLIVVDTFVYSGAMTMFWKTYYRSLLDESIDPSANSQGYNGFILTQMGFMQPTYPTGTAVHVGDLTLKCTDPSSLASSLEVAVDSAFFPPYGSFKFSPGGGTGYPPAFTGSTISLDNQVGPESKCGDADMSGGVDIDDVVYLIAFIFSGGPPPVPYESGDVDCSIGVDIDDVVWLIAYIFSGGFAPCDTDGNEVLDC